MRLPNVTRVREPHRMDTANGIPVTVQDRIHDYTRAWQDYALALVRQDWSDINATQDAVKATREALYAAVGGRGQ